VIAGGKLLEIGFGSGSFLAWARNRGAQVSGIEIIPSLLEAAKQEGIELLPHEIELHAAQFAGRFDTIIAFDVFEHFTLPEILARLDAAATMLKPGGHRVLRFPNAQSPFGLAPQNGDPTHKTALSRGVFEQMIQERPFEIARYRGSYRIGGGPLKTRVARALRRRLQDAVGRALNAIWALSIPWDPVVVLVMRKVT
jgi:SAM-dependent methyltransferase